MSFNFNEIEPKDYTNRTFGECVRKKRNELGLSVRAVAKELEMSAVYLSEIELGKRSAPSGTNSGINYMRKLINVLKLEKDEIHAFYSMAEMSLSRLSDIGSYISKKPIVQAALRLAEEVNASDDEWEKFINHLNELNSHD